MLQNYHARLLAKKQLNPTVYSFEFKLEKNQTLSFAAGQYLLLDVKTGYRQYSISSSPEQTKTLEILADVKPMGPGSQYLLNLHPNDPVSFRAPMGLFTLQNTLKPKVFLATGAGIAPIKAMITALSKQNFALPYRLFWGLSKKTDLYLHNLWLGLEQTHAKFRYTYCLSQEQTVNNQYFNGRIQQALLNYPFLPATEFYLCGRTNIIQSLRDFLTQKLGISSKQIFYENFT